MTIDNPLPAVPRSLMIYIGIYMYIYIFIYMMYVYIIKLYPSVRCAAETPLSSVIIVIDC